MFIQWAQIIHPKLLRDCDKYPFESLKSQLLLFRLSVCQTWLRYIAQPHDACCSNPNARCRQRAGWETGACVSVRQTVDSMVTESSVLREKLLYRKSVWRGPGRACGCHAEGWYDLPGVSLGKAGSWKSSMAQKYEYICWGWLQGTVLWATAGMVRAEEGVSVARCWTGESDRGWQWRRSTSSLWHQLSDGWDPGVSQRSASSRHLCAWRPLKHPR